MLQVTCWRESEQARRTTLACCSLLAGFGMAASAGHSWIHMALFAGTLTVSLYIVTDMEYPRLGLIRIEAFDHFLADAYDQMRL
jgi:hypothetical protein